MTLLEKNDQVGGRNRELRVNECVFDAGPTLMMMLDPFRKLFSDVGESLDQHLDLVPCTPNYRVFFADSQQIDCTSNMALMIEQIERMSGPEEAARYPQMIGRLAELYHASIPRFVRRNYDSPLDLVRIKSLQIALKHGMLGNLASGMAKYFKDPRLQMLFCLQTMYLGLSPYAAPWVYATLVYMEYGEGIWYPKGGMVEICRSVAKLAQTKGVDIRLLSPVRTVNGSQVTLESGEQINADAVIVNADLPYAEQNLMAAKPKKHRNRRYSCSAYMMYIDYEGELPNILHHNIVLGADFYGNLDQIFNRKQIPKDPAFYVAVSSKTDAAKAPEGHLNLFILVPCPNLDHPFTTEDAHTLQELIFARLKAEAGFDTSRVRGMKTCTPADWANELNLDRGAAFGLSHDLLQSVCFRPSNKSAQNPGVYFVGASTTPGNGLPMVLIGAELVEKRLESDGLLN